ncbi:hypothetical protein LCGC14_2913080, partial [marine sediment metagenome]
MRGSGRWGTLTAAAGAVLAVMLAWSVPARAQRTAIPFSDQAVEKAIEDAKEYLWSQYVEKLGHWAEPPPPDNPRTRSYVGGYTALACYGLLAAGESYREPRMKRALKWLAKVPMNATYCLGLRSQVWTFLPRKRMRPLLARDARQLVNSICRPSGRVSRQMKFNPR